MDLTSSRPRPADHDENFDVVYAEILRFFPELVAELGGDPNVLLARVGIDPARLAEGQLGYRLIVNILELAAVELRCPDFGLRLAVKQGGGTVFGPMGGVMRNSKTLGDALVYVRDHYHAHSRAARTRLARDPSTQMVFVSHEILLDRLPNKSQAMEQVLLLAHLNAMEITGGQARVRRVLFRHQPLSPLSTYRRYFGCEARFDQREYGVVFSDRDLQQPITDPDVQAYESATSFIDSEIPAARPPMHAQVRGVIMQFIGTEYCSNETVASALRLHPRTLHRRLNAEGKAFKAIKDDVRRDLALYYIEQTDLDLTHIAEKLGYAENSVLSRSCSRWFEASPSELRARARSAKVNTAEAEVR